MSLVGQVIGSYRVVREIGKGGMGRVYLAEHTLIGGQAALKVLLSEYSSKEDIVARFFNEARAATAIRHPGIVEIRDFGYHTDESAFIVMEYLEGETLSERIRKLGRLPTKQALRITRQLASALNAAHAKGILHRDLKPDNILIVPDPDMLGGERIKILDFGIAKLLEDKKHEHKTRTGMVMGTPTYMAPEQCRARPDADHRADLYSVGCILFKMLTGRAPFVEESTADLIIAHVTKPAPAPSEYAAGISARVDAIVQQLLAKDVERRYQTARELANAIDELNEISARFASMQSLEWNRGAPRTDTTLSAVSAEVPQASSPSLIDLSRRHSAWLAAVALVAIVGGVALAIWMSGGAGRRDVQPLAPSAGEVERAEVRDTPVWDAATGADRAAANAADAGQDIDVDFDVDFELPPERVMPASPHAPDAGVEGAQVDSADAKPAEPKRRRRSRSKPRSKIDTIVWPEQNE